MARDVIDSLLIAGIEDREGRSVPNNNMRLRLQTIDNQQGLARHRHPAR